MASIAIRPTWRVNSGSQNGFDGNHVLLYQPFLLTPIWPLRMSLAPFSQGRRLFVAPASRRWFCSVEGRKNHRRDAGATTHVMRISPSSKRKDACAVHETYQCFSIAARLVRAADTM